MELAIETRNLSKTYHTNGVAVEVDATKQIPQTQAVPVVVLVDKTQTLHLDRGRPTRVMQAAKNSDQLVIVLVVVVVELVPLVLLHPLTLVAMVVLA